MVKAKTGYRANRARISLALSQFTVPLLSRIYHAFNGDMVAAIVLGEIAHRNVEAWLIDHENPEDPLYDPSLREQVMRPCNALSIAQACDLPRETVRRKVNWLIERGYLRRNDKGHLFVTATVGDDYESLTDEFLQSLLATAARLQALQPRRRHRARSSGSGRGRRARASGQTAPRRSARAGTP